MKIFYAYKNKENSLSMLNYVLDNYYGIKSASILKNENGKPYIADNPVYFNVTHTDGLIMIAVSNVPVGIDAEYIVPKNDKYHVVSKKFLTEEENARVNTYKDFLILWTKKESFIKAIGGGVFKDFKKITFKSDGIIYDGELSTMKSYSFDFDDYVYSIASTDTEKQLVLLI